MTQGTWVCGEKLRNNRRMGLTRRKRESVQIEKWKEISITSRTRKHYQWILTGTSEMY